MAVTVFDVLVEKLNEEITVRESSLCTGSAKDFPEYSHQVGTIRGLRVGLQLVTDLSRTYMEDNDD